MVNIKKRFRDDILNSHVENKIAYVNVDRFGPVLPEDDNSLYLLGEIDKINQVPCLHLIGNYFSITSYFIDYKVQNPDVEMFFIRWAASDRLSQSKNPLNHYVSLNENSMKKSIHQTALQNVLKFEKAVASSTTIALPINIMDTLYSARVGSIFACFALNRGRAFPTSYNIISGPQGSKERDQAIFSVNYINSVYKDMYQEEGINFFKDAAFGVCYFGFKKDSILPVAYSEDWLYENKK